MPEIRIDTEDFPMVEAPASIADPVVISIPLDRVVSVKRTSGKLMVELRSRRRSDSATIEAQHGLSDKPWEDLA